MFDMILNARRKWHNAYSEPGADPYAVSIYAKLLHAWDMQSSGVVVDLHSGLNLTTNFGVVHHSSGGLCASLPEYNSYEASASSRSQGPQSPSLIGHVDIACTFWARRTGSYAAGTGGFVFAERALGDSSVANSQVEIICRPDGKVTFQWESGSGVNRSVSTTATPMLVDETHFIACSRNTTAKQISFYIDGVVETEPTYLIGPSGGSGATTWVANYDALNANFEGWLAGLWVYSEQLTADEVDWLYNGGAGRNYPDLLALAGL